MVNKSWVMTIVAVSAISTFNAQPVFAQSVEELKAQLAALAKRIEQLEKKQAAEEKKKAPIVTKAEPAFPIATSDGLFEMNVRGRVYVDAAWASDDDDAMDLSATEFRAARIGIEGKAWKSVKYKFEADFAHNDVSLKDALLEYSAPFGRLKVGHFKTPNSLEEQSSSRHVTFMERASFTDAFGLARMIGVGYGVGGDNWTFNAGLFRGDASSSVDAEGETVAARLTYGQAFENGTWMVGASARYQNVGDASDIRYRQRPHNHLTDRFIATNRIASEDTFYGFEGAMQMGAFHIASEYAEVTAHKGGAGGRDAKFFGGYVEAGWFITGESKPLNLSKGVWDRPKVKKPLHEGGLGAWQIAAKFDRVDLTGDGVYGGEQDTYILGVNWYLNRHTRFIANYSHSEIEKAFNVTANGVDGENTVDTLGLRFQVDW